MATSIEALSTLVRQWRVIPSLPAYEASSDGLIRRKLDHSSHEVLIRQYLSGVTYRKKNGTVTDKSYLQVVITLAPRKSSRKQVSRLVCEAFHGPPPFPGAEAAHKNGNRLDNCKDNLRWATPRQNWQDRIIHGTDLRGSKIGTSKLSEKLVTKIRNSLLWGRSPKILAKEYGVHYSTIYRIRSGTRWRPVVNG